MIGTSLSELVAHRLVPVLVVDDPDVAELVAHALVAGGLPVAEVTLRAPRALEVLARMSEERRLLVGAGTVLDVEQVDAAVEAGARFIVSPGLDLEVTRRCQERGVPCIPGVATATEVQAARRAGLGLLKLFPAGPLGGVNMVEALAAPFPDLRFLPTGGITPEQVASYLSSPAVAAVGGSFVVPRATVARRDTPALIAAVRAAVALTQAVASLADAAPGPSKER